MAHNERVVHDQLVWLRQHCLATDHRRTMNVAQTTRRGFEPTPLQTEQRCNNIRTRKSINGISQSINLGPPLWRYVYPNPTF